MRDRLVSVVGGRASLYVCKKKPSEFIPFKGNFPLIRPYQMEDYMNEVSSKMWIEDMSPEFQKATMDGNRIALFEEGFKNYLNSYNITTDMFLKMSNSDKSDKLISWLEHDGIDFSQLTIK